MQTATSAAPVILLASPDEVFARSLESVLAPAGYSVLRAYTARSAFEQERRARPDALILAKDLVNPEGIALCRALRQEDGVTPSTPIFLTQASPATRPQRIEALRAGADELWGQPMDTEEFALRLAAQLRAKFDADRARKEGLVDQRTGLWNARGLVRRATELLAQTLRDHVPIAAAAVGMEGTGAADAWDLGDRLAAGLRRNARLSDAVGRVDAAQFVVIAPRTGAAASARLCERLLEGLDDVLDDAATRVRVRCVAFEDAATTPAAAELIGRAVAALRDGNERA